MKNLSQLLKRRSKADIENEVNDELAFHLDMQTHDYQNLGISAEKSRVMAEKRFGDVKRIRNECVRISKGSTLFTLLLNSMFLLSLVIGLFVRVLIPEPITVKRIGDVMMMIGVLGILLVYAKRAGSMVLQSKSNSLNLDLGQPVAFDEKGRTPFERVRADD